MPNSIFTIHPRLDSGVLLFDDPERGISREPFVAGADSIIGNAAKAVGWDLETGFPLLFSAGFFPGAAKATRLDDPCETGAWYLVGSVRGWLCPVTLQYFGEYPEKIWFTVPGVVLAVEVSP